MGYNAIQSHFIQSNADGGAAAAAVAGGHNGSGDCAGSGGLVAVGGTTSNPQTANFVVMNWT